MLRRLALVSVVAVLSSLPLVSAAAGPRPGFAPVGTYRTGLGSASAEIAAYANGLLYVTNSDDNSLDIVDARNLAAPRLLRRVDLSAFGAGPNSVAVSKSAVAVAVEADPKTAPGAVVFLDRGGAFLNAVPVGALPDMLVFTRDGHYLLVANEGEPNRYGAADSVDPEGSVTIIHVTPPVLRPNPGGTLPPGLVRTVDFRAFNVGGPRHAELDGAIRIVGPGASVAQDLEPEYIAIAGDGKRAYVTLQENNAIATISIPSARVERLVALGAKDHSAAGNGLDASDRDGAIAIRPWPVRGLFMPDAVATYTAGGATFLVTANEGDARDYDGFAEEVRVASADFPLAASAFPDAAALKAPAALGRLTTTTTSPRDANGTYTAIEAFGTRSFSVWGADGRLVFDSGDQFEQHTAAALPAVFNAENEETSFDTRSDNKGPEPEGIAVGTINGRTYAFTCLERIGGLMIYDVSDPRAPVFVQYLNNRDFAQPVEDADGTINPLAGDLGPEGVSFVPSGRWWSCPTKSAAR